MKKMQIIEKHARSIHHVVEAYALASNIEEQIGACIERCIELEKFMDKDDFQTLVSHCIDLKSTAIDARSATHDALDVAKEWALRNMNEEFKQLEDED
jgi:hypothetical protein